MNTFDLILPNIRSCHNVGAMFRTADAFDIQKLYLVGWTATPPKPQIDKVALGAETWMPWEHKEDLRMVIEELRGKGVRIIALEKTDHSQPIDDLIISEPIALIVGNEVSGVPEEIQAICNDVVHIPMYGKKESLNVSVAAGVAMHVLTQKIKSAG